MSKLNLEGQRFGKLTVVSYVGEIPGKTSHGKYLWKCKCDCGKEKETTQHNLIYGSTKSCGCLKHGAILTGQKFGRWTVLEEVESVPRKDGKGIKKAWKCRCDCGNEGIVIQDLLVSGHSKSCGCLQPDITRERFKDYTSIQRENPRLYKTWLAMRRRCNSPDDQHHANYYDRGIKVCPEWDKSFEPFCEWALSHGYSDNLTIERIDVNGNYEPNNCKWITNAEQQWNKTNTIHYVLNGEVLTTHEICERYNIKPVTLYARMKRYGYTLEQAVNQPRRKWTSHKTRKNAAFSQKYDK